MISFRSQKELIFDGADRHFENLKRRSGSLFFDSLSIFSQFFCVSKSSSSRKFVSKLPEDSEVVKGSKNNKRSGPTGLICLFVPISSWSPTLDPPPPIRETAQAVYFSLNGSWRHLICFVTLTHFLRAGMLNTRVDSDAISNVCSSEMSKQPRLNSWNDLTVWLFYKETL